MSDKIGRIVVVSKRSGGILVPPGYHTVLCDRTTPLGNPYIMDNDTPSERDRVIDLYRRDFAKLLAKERDMAFMYLNIAHCVAVGHDVALQCWCAPRACHCDVIRSAIGNMLSVGKIPEVLLKKHFPNFVPSKEPCEF